MKTGNITERLNTSEGDIKMNTKGFYEFKEMLSDDAELLEIMADELLESKKTGVKPDGMFEYLRGNKRFSITDVKKTLISKLKGSKWFVQSVV